ncbi:SDR family NAD(P)-dependent oxidoreductase [Labrenzia suaedae]|uniref:SDR family NAD(P)-dependent oxidoreductase n=1 Tax=Roseibium litorale TaxID=2803841 RepID=A0ABR9CPR1_9HYPH|nr:SDR family NAD(P)-dependent oxidoreductase [Roseibium litorale]
MGYSSRLPGAKSAADFWSLLDQGKCAVTSVDPERWPLPRFGHPDKSVVGKAYTWAAGQIDDVWGFDPSFFGISPREAFQMDPQQRLLLQLVWEALEHANVKPSELAGTNTGVYVGASSLDYHHRFLNDPSNADMQFMTGNTLSIISNRISYIYDLRGPSFTVDTACSSSLVALHEAVCALESGQIDTAVICGVSLLLSPFAFVGFSRATMLSQTGLCQAFDAKGDGYVRSEGGVSIVLRARRAGKLKGSRSYGQLLATGINADGRTVGMSLPSAYAQAGLLREIYWDMGISPESLAFVEAHGTGTRVGDPAEAEALGTVIGQKRSTPLHIGSVKTNVGHLEPVSGLVGLLKAVMALEHNKLPKSLHFETPNPDIPFEDLNLKVASESVDLAPSDKPRLAGVNSFGFGGTNAHAVIADPEPSEQVEETAPVEAPLVISARSKAALKQLAKTYADRLSEADAEEAAKIVVSAAHGRDLLAERLVVSGASAAEKVEVLAAFAADEASPNAVSGDALRPSEKVGFVFSGNGAQWAGMGRDAYRTDEAFRLAFEQVDRIFMGLGGWSLLTTLYAEDLENDIERTEIAQPLLFAIQVSLVKSLKSRGIEPDGVAGHSVGEVAAAWCCGALTLEQAVKVIHARSTEQEVVRDLGTMGALLLPADQAQAAIDKSGLPRLEVAAINSPRSVTISGDAESLDAFSKFARKNKWAMRRLNLAYPFHSALVDPIKEPLLKALSGVTPGDAAIPFHSTVDTDSTAPVLNADYWWRNVRQPVLFSAAIDAMIEAGNGILVEIGPKPVLGTYMNDILRASGKKAKILGSLDQPAKGAVASGNPVDRVAAQILANGGRTDLDRFVAPAPSDLAQLPLYPWQNAQFKIEPTGELIDYIVGNTFPLLGYRLRKDAAEWFNHLDPASLPWLADHKVEESIVFPAAGFTEMALQAALSWSQSDAIEVRDMDILRPLVFEEGDVWETLVRISPDDKVIEILSRPRLQDSDFGLNARGHFVSVSNASRTPWLDAGTSSLSVLEHDALYEITRSFGLDYGDAFARVEKVVTHDQRNATVHLRPQIEKVAAAELSLCPTLADAGFHGLFALLRSVEGIPEKTSFLPIRIGSVRLLRSGTPPVEVRIRVTKASSRSIEASFEYLDVNGQVVARMSQVRFRAVKLGRDTRPNELVYRQFAALLPDASRLAPVDKVMEGGFKAFAGAAGVGGDTPPDLGDAAILLEALGRSIAHSVLYGLSGNGKLSAASLTADGKLEDSAKPLLQSILSWLQDNDLATEESGVWTLADPAEGPSAKDLMQAIAVEAPKHVAEAALLARLETDLQELLTSGLKTTAQDAFSSSLFDAYRTASPSASVLADALRELGTEVVKNWPREDALKVLIVGASSSGLGQEIDARIDPSRMQAVITDPSDALLGRAERLWTGSTATSFLEFSSEELAAVAPFDLILCGASLAEMSREQLAQLARMSTRGALLLAAEALPSPLTNLLRGTGIDWWSQSVSDEFPLSLQDADWAKALEAAGFGSVETIALDSDELEADILAARISAEPQATAVSDEGEDKASDAVKTFLLLADEEGCGRKLADGLASCLEAEGATVLRAVSGESTAKTEDGSWTVSPDGDPGALKALLKDSGYQVVHLLGAYDGSTDALAATDLRTWSLTQLLNTIGADDARLTIVAPGGMQSLAGGASHVPAQAGVWAYGRVAMNEFPNANIRLVDVSPDLEPGLAAARLAAELLQESAEREVILDGSHRSGLRIVQGGTLPESTLPEGASPAMRLDILRQGSLDQLAWQAVARTVPTGSEVEIAVEASGLNFRDVMWALGLLPEEALEDGFAGPTLGMECCGTITAVGDKVTRFQPGDKVITFAPACFASHVSVDESGCAPMPSSVSSEEAATIPVTFLTAYYALVHLAKLSAGETILIHGGAGGVGLAALQIAKWRGAKVIATAGSREKRNFLRLLGADVVLDSRSLEFVDAVMADTLGEGVDVVLNSLFGEAMERSIEVLKPFGRFLELGKRDYYGNTRIGLRPFRQNLTYFGIDADQLLTRQPALAEALFRDLVELFENRTFTPLPYRVFEADRVVDAFRLMQQAGHIGKIVLRPPVVPQSVPVEKSLALSSDGTYVIAGGFGGFGVELLKRLGSLGARNLAVLSRRGDASDEAKAAIADLAAMGVTARAFACDITDEATVSSSLETIRKELPAIKGVFHTAMVLNDVLIANLKHDGLTKVLAPKVRGAELLDRLTRQDPVEHFVLYSSATTLVGNPGQANYVAANGYLEGLARKRRAEGLPALTVAWGAISDAGYLARNEDVNEMLSRKLGRHALSAQEALDGLTALMCLPGGTSDQETAALGYARIDWQAARRDLALLSTPLVSYLGLGDSDDTGAGDGAIDLAALLEGMDKVTASQTVAKLLAAEIGKILRISPEEIDPHKPLSEIGMDSLMALELRMGAERQLGIDIPLMSLANGATLIDLSTRVATRVLGEGGDDSISAESRTLASQHVNDGESEVEGLTDLAEKVEGKSRELGSFL